MLLHMSLSSEVTAGAMAAVLTLEICSYSMLHFSFGIHIDAFPFIGVKSNMISSLYKGSVNFVRVESKGQFENRGTIVVLNRYAAALCFLDVLEMVVR